VPGWRTFDCPQRSLTTNAIDGAQHGAQYTPEVSVGLDEALLNGVWVPLVMEPRRSLYSNSRPIHWLGTRL